MAPIIGTIVGHVIGPIFCVGLIFMGSILDLFCWPHFQPYLSWPYCWLDLSGVALPYLSGVGYYLVKA